VAAAGEHSRQRPPEHIAAAAPDILLVSPCGHGTARAAEEGRRLLALDEWAWARERETWAIDANGLVSRPGPRLVDGIEVMAAIFHPSLFPTPSAAQAIRIPASAYRAHGAPATM
jgi:iron complex transport system substrate-binding protein